MKALKFTLEGKTAFFKKPEVNSHYYFTFGQIHKVALLGMFGAILGYGGYAQKEWAGNKKRGTIIEEAPEFYERLKEIQVSVIPRNSKGYIPKKVQTFNNSVGYASKEQGGNLIVKEQWLEQPQWDIYVLLNCDEAQKIANAVLGSQCVFNPYLGKNDHPADITNAELVELQETDQKEVAFSGLFPKDIGELLPEDEEEEIQVHKYEETLPVGLDMLTNLYIYRTFCFTNLSVNNEHGTIYQTIDQAPRETLVFY